MAMKVVIDQSLKEVPRGDEEVINKRKQKSLTKVITDEDKGLHNFGIAEKIQKIMSEQQKRKKGKEIVIRGKGGIVSQRA